MGMTFPPPPEDPNHPRPSGGTSGLGEEWEQSLPWNSPPPPPPTHTPHGQPDDGGLSGLGEEWESALPWNTPEFEQQAQPSRRQKKPQGQRSNRPRRGLPWKPVLAVVAIVTLIGGAFFGIQALISGSNSSNPDPGSKSTPDYPPLTRPAPPGWTRDVAWRAEAALQSNVAVGHGHIAYLTTSGLLIVHDATTGETIYSSTPTGLSKNAEVAITSTPAPVIAAWDGEKLVAWSLNGKRVGKSVDNPLPDGAAVTDNGGGVVAAAPGNEAWALRADLHLHKVDLPANQVPLAMTGDGQIIAAPSTGRWSVINSKGKATPVRYALAATARGNAMYPAWSANGVVVAWAPTKDDQTRAVAFYDAITGKTLAEATLPTSQVNLGLPLSVTPDGNLAAAGPLLANLTTGKTTVVDDWATTIGTEGALYGKDSSDTRYMWTGEPKGPAALDSDTAIPWGVHQDFAVVTDQGSSRGLLIAAIKRDN